MRNKLTGAVTLLLLTTLSFAQDFQRTQLGVKANAQFMDIEVQFFSPTIVRIIKIPESSSLNKRSLSVIKSPEQTVLIVNQENNKVHLKSTSLQVELNLKTGKISFSDLNSHPIFTEKDYGTQFTAITDAGLKRFSVRQAFMLGKDEAIYGLGQQQTGKMNQRNQKIYLSNQNTKVCIPFIQSVKGYGIFWDNYSPTTFNDNLQETSFDSEIGDCSDYYFMWGGSGDGVVAQMRDLTGQAPMMPLWVYGYHQSKERYKTQDELLSVVKKYRDLKVPLDGIVQDWQYWGKDSLWNSMSFDPATYPNPKGMVDKVHQLNAHLFIVAWPGFGPLTKQYAEFKSKNMLIDFDTWPPNSGAKPYDPYNPASHAIYWDYLNKGVFSLGTDGWWLDSTEPDHINIKDKDFDQPTYLGSFRSVINAFPLEHVGGIYDSQRKTTSQKRVTIFTRSAFAGQQRYAANTWSGDVVSTWPTLQRQIPAALNFSLSGIPYWNADIGGFFAGAFNKGGGAKNPEFQELYTRWLQFAAFTPMMRSHGTDIPREIYQFGQPGDKTYDVLAKFINLRYSLLPYIYATAWDVTHHSGSIMRALFMDFEKDQQVYNIGNQYMFGKSLMVSPVTQAGQKEQAVYLPGGALWYDFWTGKAYDGGKSITAATPIDILPLYVKAGTIIPWGPQVQFAEEKKWDNLEIRVYPGADGDFTLYEDENDNYNYESGKYTEIPFHWDNKSLTLTIDKKKGGFAGTLVSRKFNIILVTETKGTGAQLSKQADKVINYKGAALSVSM
ncbi:glycoside hydrolase family 31 protein [Mucilaginibacter paludis]|uniref:Glycoside hydrolase family 31 n=1 Tax=Mucilaginibacter paludis DSM 18603 TaxID=714943 RepID=H1Y378_9SPHI|nr:glycoside hydrolase family 31 protein [Mucilaginibacter paludis]EHQ28896.1 glycoside hydrolase family 31 [Mucilaginibacter paludis DSM 18603]